ncbi:M14 family zinc carboxypeptidase [Mariniflexile jejuense]|uniref:M14 family zinc carboxypeptidase n=1 Tax=Mariniflexile jejuense TaxID=1173582 RepID=A0ABW3JKM8_9FLAO
MNKITLTLILLLYSTFALTQQNNTAKRISISNPSESVLIQIKKAGIDLNCGPRFINNNLELELSNEEILELKKNGINYTILIDDLTKFYSEKNAIELPKAKVELTSLKSNKNKKSNTSSTQKSLSKQNVIVGNPVQHDECSEINWTVPNNFQLGSMGGCLTVSETLAQLDLMRSLYPNLISIKADASSIGQKTYGNTTGSTTWPGQTVYYVRISDNPNIDETNEPETLITGMTHAREVNSLMNVMYFMWYILENYDSDPFIKNVVDNQELYFIPIINPDGLRWNEVIAPSGGGLQRKNLRPGTADNGTNSTTNNVRGVDLNRNFNYYWGWDNSGSSPTASSNVYRGPSAGSEPETQILQDFVLNHDFKIAVNHHGGLNSIVTSSYNGSVLALDSGREDEYAKLCHDLTHYNRYIYGSAPNTLYEANGDTNDWMLGGPAVSSGGQTNAGSGKNVLTIAPENGDDFWPSPSLITPIAQNAMRTNFLSVLYSGKFAKLHDLNASNIATTTGNLNFGVEYLGKTYNNITLNVTPISSNITSITSPPVQTGWNKLEQRNLSIPFILNANIQPNDKIEFQVTLSNNDFVIYQANYIKYYQPSILFQDNPDVSGITNWTSSGGSWGTTDNAYSGSTAITDSPSGSYSNNESKTLTLNTSINLSNSSSALVQFYAKWDIERNYDLVQFEASTNSGSSWAALCGNYNKPAATAATNYHLNKNTTAFKDHQSLNGAIIYDGDTMDKWVMEEILINNTQNSFLLGQSNIQFRFRFKSDSTNREDDLTTTFDGFTFDDFKVLGFIAPCVTEVPSGITNSSTTQNSTNITWSNIPSTTYDLRYKISGSSTWTTLIGLTSASANLAGLAASTNYEVQVRSNCGVSNSAYSSSYNFTTASIVYCASNGNSSARGYTRNVTFGIINNTTAFGAGGYSDFTSISTDVMMGSNYSISIGKQIVSGRSAAVSVWIDYNKDGDFDDANELILNSAASTTATITGTITIPQSATPGNTRMRVSLRNGGTPVTCGAFTYGEVEDYSINIQSLVDTTPPVITLNGASTLNLFIGNTYTELGAAASDNKDGNISANIVISGSVNTAIAGTYNINYNVSDAAGNQATQVSRTINVVPDTIAPVITLNGASTINLNVSDTYTELGATATDNKDGNISANIIIGGTVNTAVAGTYIKTYNVTDAAGNNATQVTRTIIVASAPSNVVLHQGYFETGNDGWTLGSGDAGRYAGSRSYEGSYSLYIRDNSGIASSITSPILNLSPYSQVEIRFYFYPTSMETNEDFWLLYYNGSTWSTIKTYVSGTNFNNNSFYTSTVTLNASQYNFATNSQFRFQCDASANDDLVYIDQVIITGLGTNNSAKTISGKVLDVSENTIVENNFKLYPNPVNGAILNIKLSKESNVSYKIINMLGQVISIGKTTKEIPVGNLENGTYFLEVNDGEQVMTKRFIKN